MTRKPLDSRYLAKNGFKLCVKCNSTLSLDRFHKNSRARDGLVNFCKDCARTIDAVKYQTNKEAIKSRVRNNPEQRVSKYQITRTELEELRVAQGNVCAICGTPPSSKKDLCIDHSHKTGQVRGLLCHSCNLALGYFKDDITRLVKATRYLQK